MNYNQNDPVYKNTMLGSSKKYSLFSSGCYVFSLAYILGIDPTVCNETLKNAGVFMADNTGDVCLLNHSKIALAFPNKISSVAKYDSYDNEACLEAIAQNGKCIVKVDYDGNPNSPLDTHFVTFIGNKKLFDSLGGIVKPTSTYPLLTGLRVVTLKNSSSDNMYRGYDLSNNDSNKVAIDRLCDIMDGKYVSQEEHQKIITELDSKSTEMAQNYAKEKQTLLDKISFFEETLRKLQDTEHTWETTADDYQRKLSAIIQEFRNVGIEMSIENSEEVLVYAVRDYISDREKDKNFVLSVTSNQPLTSPDTVLEALGELESAKKEIITLEKKIKQLENKDLAISTYQFGKYIIKIYKK